MKKSYLLYCCLLFVTTSLFAQKNANARKVLDTTTSKFEAAGGIKTNFSITSYNRKNELIADISGTILLKGVRFNTITPEMTTWFDGTTQWSYFKNNREVNITTPTQEELQSLNPYSFLSLYKKGFNYTLSEDKFNQKILYEVRLTAQKKELEIQEVLLSIDKVTYSPVRIRIRKGGEWTHITLTNYQTGVQLPESTFRFDAKKIPQAEIIDLR